MSKSNIEISRVTRTKLQAKAAYNRLSNWYDFLEGGFENKAIVTGITMLRPQQGEKILELGFGTGISIIHLARRVGDSGKVYGLDLSEGMLHRSQTKVAKEGLSPKVELMIGDAVNLPYQSGTFDAVFMSFTLELFDTPEIPLVLGECRRVLKPIGRICIVSMSKKGHGIMLSIYEWAHRTFPRYIDCRPIFLGKVLKESEFNILESKNFNIWGLPVEISLAQLLDSDSR